MNPDDYKQQIEGKIANFLEEALHANTIPEERVELIAQTVSQTFQPELEIDQIYSVAKDLEQLFPELVPVLNDVHQDREQKLKDATLAKAHTLIQENKIEEADKVLEEAIEQDANESHHLKPKE